MRSSGELRYGALSFPSALAHPPRAMTTTYAITIGRFLIIPSLMLIARNDGRSADEAPASKPEAWDQSAAEKKIEGLNALKDDLGIWLNLDSIEHGGVAWSRFPILATATKEVGRSSQTAPATASMARSLTITYPLARFPTCPRLPNDRISHVLQHLALEHPVFVLQQPSFLPSRYIGVGFLRVFPSQGWQTQISLAWGAQ